MQKLKRLSHYSFLFLYMSFAILFSCKKDEKTSSIAPVPMSPSITVTDIDGNIYNTVTIGTQTWMVENLKTTRYNDGSSIPLVTDGNAWDNLTSHGYCYYNNDLINKQTYGCLYNYYAAKATTLAPVGWHVPSDTEWKTLENFLISNGYNFNGTTLGNYCAKALASTNLWVPETNTGAPGNTDYSSFRNKSGFTGLPAGIRFFGNYEEGGTSAYWWSTKSTSSTTAHARYILSTWVDFHAEDNQSKECGCSVRCIKD